MGTMKRHSCGYCGAKTSPIIVHGKEIQQAWYKDKQFGYLCRNCYNRLNRTGDIMLKRERREQEESQIMRKANLMLKPHGWECVKIWTNMCRADKILYVYKYELKCRHCGRVVIWTGELEDFVRSKECICNCKFIAWAFSNNAFPKKGNGTWQRIAKAIAENPNANQSDIARELGLSRQRVEQVRTGLRAAYMVEMKRIYGEIAKVVTYGGED